MAIESMNPAGLMQPQGFAQVGIATGSRTIYLSGQTPQDADGNVVGVGDLAAQTDQALTNVTIALDAAGATFADVAKLTVYVVGWKPELAAPLIQGVQQAAGRLGLDMNRPLTLVGVEALFSPDFLIEIDATAVVD
jgi:enamine deaminase RidA (YjgF/YER057c/UK114 family)